ncbi:MAG: TIGR02996 domain-containing protein [Myxococcota bacterium]
MTEAELIDGIVADPDADDPRSVYADWLDERGEEAQARFVRAQVASARQPAWDPRQVDHRVVEAATRGARRAREARWPYDADGVRIVGWERGLPARADLDSFDALVAHQNTLRRLGVTEIRVPLPTSQHQVRSLGALPTVRRLWIADPPGSEARRLRWLLASPLARHLDELGLLIAGPLDREALASISESPGWSGLRRFSLFRARMDEDDLVWLLEALPAGLTELGFGVSLPRRDDGAYVGDDHPEPLRVLAEWPGLVRIERLDVFLTRPGEEGVGQLLASRHAGSLRDLGLNIVARALGFPASPSSRFRLHTLRILHGELSRGLGADLAGAACLSELKVLRLRGIRVVPSEVFRAMFQGPLRTSLQVVDDRGTEVGALYGLLDGLALGRLERLHTLSLPNSNVSKRVEPKRHLDRQLDDLFATPVFDTLREIVLRDHIPGEPHVSGLTIHRMLQAPELRRLRVPTSLTEAEAEALATHPRVVRLLASGGLDPDVIRATRTRAAVRR